MDSQDFRPLATTPAAQAAYLRQILTEEIQQKVRVEDLITRYTTNIDAITESIIDEHELKNTVSERPDSAEKMSQLQHIDLRIKTLTDAKTDQVKFLGDIEADHNRRIDLQQSHLIELTDLEMAAGGFVAHLFGLRGEATFDASAKALLIPSGSSAEAGIAARLVTWKDSSQLTIIRKED